jgi:hypothetical protein
MRYSRRRFVAGVAAGFGATVLRPQAAEAAIYSIRFFSQRDQRWANQKLGWCGATIGELEGSAKPLRNPLRRPDASAN